MGLILPPLVHVGVVLSPIAGAALAVLMVGATVTHVRRKENPGPALVLAVLSIAAAVLGLLALT